MNALYKGIRHDAACYFQITVTLFYTCYTMVSD